MLIHTMPMERMYLNMYLTMKHFERIKYHPYFPVNLHPTNEDTEKFSNKSEDRITSEEIHDDKLENLRRSNENEPEDFHKLDDSDSQSSHDSGEYIDTCNLESNTDPDRLYRQNRDISQIPSHNGSSSRSSVHGHTDFSIDRILSQDTSFKTSRHFNKFEEQFNEFDWLRCTRYKPPKIYRLRKKEAPKKRTPGCNPRIPFSEATLKAMEAKYQESAYITGDNLKGFARAINVSKERIVVWFQNRRARQRREEEARAANSHTAHSRHRTGSSSSHSDHGSASIDNCGFADPTRFETLMIHHPL